MIKERPPYTTTNVQESVLYNNLNQPYAPTDLAICYESQRLVDTYTTLIHTLASSRFLFLIPKILWILFLELGLDFVNGFSFSI